MNNIELKSVLNPVHLENLGRAESPSIYVRTKDYEILHLRVLTLVNSNLSYDHLTYFFFNGFIYSVSSSHDLTELKAGYKDLHYQIENQISFLTHLIEEHSLAIESLEDRMFDRLQLRNILNEIFEHKKSLMKLGRIFDRSSAILKEYTTTQSDKITEFSEEFTDLVYDSEYCLRQVNALIGKLDNIFNLYTSIKNDNLNKNIYILSIISGVFLPLNLIVGFFGMNTNGLFLSQQANGTQLVFYAIISIFIIMILGLPILYFLDKFIVSKVLGRYRFYSRISKKIESLNDDFNILEKK